MLRRNYLKADRNSRTARRKIVLIVAGVILFLYFGATRLLGDMGVVKYFRMKAQYATLAEDIVKLKKDNVRLRREVSALKSDPVYLERVARDKLGLAREGEIVYNYPNL